MALAQCLRITDFEVSEAQTPPPCTRDRIANPTALPGAAQEGESHMMTSRDCSRANVFCRFFQPIMFN